MSHCDGAGSNPHFKSHGHGHGHGHGIFILATHPLVQARSDGPAPGRQTLKTVKNFPFLATHSLAEPEETEPVEPGRGTSLHHGHGHGHGLFILAWPCQIGQPGQPLNTLMNAKKSGALLTPAWSAPTGTQAPSLWRPAGCAALTMCCAGLNKDTVMSSDCVALAGLRDPH